MSTELEDVLDEVMMMSGNSFIGDLEAVGFSTHDFIRIVKLSLGTWTEYRNVPGTININTSNNVVDLRELLDYVPKVVSRVTVNCRPTGFTYDCGVLTVSESGCLSIEYKSDPSTLLMLKDGGRADRIDSWILNITPSQNRLDELIKFITGNFMVALGRATRRFNIQEMPIGLDSDSLISEGSRMVEELTRQMQETSDAFDNILRRPNNSPVASLLPRRF